jgi:tRNA(Ile)-lysidine synthase
LRASDSAAPNLSPDRFARLIARLGPFETAPHLAVAVSGGPDSMALALLLAEWVHGRNGHVDALTVDHGLRPESAAEAQQVGGWLAHVSGLSHRILTWSGPKPESGIQAAAREARYRLLAEHCRDTAILHLCVAHHRDDQIETHRLRAGHGSGSLGLAGMSAIRPLAGVRLLRPLLGVAKAELLALLTRRRQAWITDPSNANPAFERARLRASADASDSEPQAAALHRLGLVRQQLEREAAGLLAETLTLHPAGWGALEPEAFAGTGPANLLAFGWVLQSVGGNDYPVAETRRAEALERIRADHSADFTLGGCHLRRSGAGLWIFRDWGAIRHRTTVAPGTRLAWDDRFAVTVSRQLPANLPLTVARLGESGLRRLGQEGHNQADFGVPEPARKALPALWQGDRLVSVPQLRFGPGWGDGGLAARFQPARSAASGGFTVA